MKITDLEGRLITVTDLDASIEMVVAFMQYTHIDAEQSLTRLEEQRLRYWTDIHGKLIFLKNAETNGNH